MRERDQISDDDREGGQRGQERRPAGDHRMPGRAAMQRTEGNQENFSEDDERRDLRAGSDEGGAGDRRALVGVGRPEMEWRGGDLESETDQRHDDAGGEQWFDGLRLELLPDGGEPGRAAHSVNEAQPEKGECARRAAEEKILQAGLGGTAVGFVERGHDVERQPGQFESDENHEQLFAADEQHQSDRGEQNQREIFALVARGAITARENDGEKGEHQADDFEERGQRRDHEHAVEEIRVRRQPEHGDDSEEETDRRNEGVKLAQRDLVRPSARTTSAVTATCASGEASRRSSR